MSSFTNYGWTLCLWILIIPFQYGYHISVLNQIQAVLTCKTLPVTPSNTTAASLPQCVPMSDWTFSAVTAIFTLGGLLGSSVANLVMERYGRKGTARISALFVLAGTGLMTVGWSVGILGFGRMLVGIGSGIGLCVGPIYLAEIAPAKISGNVGVLTQLGIVLGIMITQLLGLILATPSTWRIVLLASCILSSAQFLLSSMMLESPAYLGSKKLVDERRAVERRLWVAGERHVEDGSSRVRAERDGVQEPLLADEAEMRRAEGRPGPKTVGVPQLFGAPELRRPLMIVCLAMLSQQLSGINAVLYYSNDILSKTLPEFGPYVSLGITIINTLMTFPPIILIEKMGRKSLLTISTMGAIASLLTVGYGLDAGNVTLSSVAILTFVTSFAVGLGPVPFVIIPEVSPFHAVSALSSVALSLNWIANFLVGLIFLPLRNFLSGGAPGKEGRVFFVFAAVLALSMSGLVRVYRG